VLLRSTVRNIEPKMQIKGIGYIFKKYIKRQKVINMLNIEHHIVNMQTKCTIFTF